MSYMGPMPGTSAGGSVPTEYATRAALMEAHYGGAGPLADGTYRIPSGGIGSVDLDVNVVGGVLTDPLVFGMRALALGLGAYGLEADLDTFAEESGVGYKITCDNTNPAPSGETGLEVYASNRYDRGAVLGLYIPPSAAPVELIALSAGVEFGVVSADASNRPSVSVGVVKVGATDSGWHTRVHFNSAPQHATGYMRSGSYTGGPNDNLHGDADDFTTPETLRFTLGVSSRGARATTGGDVPTAGTNPTTAGKMAHSGVSANSENDVFPTEMRTASPEMRFTFALYTEGTADAHATIKDLKLLVESL